MKELFHMNYGNDHAIIESQVVMLGTKEKPEFQNRVNSIFMFTAQYDNDGRKTDTMKKYQLNDDDIIRMAARIIEIRTTPASAKDYEQTDDLPF